MNARGELAVFGPNTRLLSDPVEHYFWSGIPLGSEAVANLLLEIAFGALAWRACRRKSLSLLGLGLILDFVWRIPLAVIQASELSFHHALYYEGLGLFLTLGFLFHPAVARRWPSMFLWLNDERRPAKARNRESASLFAVWRDQKRRDNDH
jgi:hypothetical protein